jgi:hypothetical protein
MSMIGFEKAAADLGISVTKLQSSAPAATAANVPTATTTVAGTVLKSATVANCTVAADGTSAGTQLNALLTALRAAGHIV